MPDAVAAELADASTDVPPPARLLQYVGSGTAAWVAAEGALKIRETAYVAAAGYSMEYLLHGPSVAVGADDALVVLDGGGRGSARLARSATRSRATARTSTASAATRSARRSRCSR